MTDKVVPTLERVALPAAVAYLDENETVTGQWTFNNALKIANTQLTIERESSGVLNSLTLRGLTDGAQLGEVRIQASNALRLFDGGGAEVFSHTLTAIDLKNVPASNLALGNNLACGGFAVENAAGIIGRADANLQILTGGNTRTVEVYTKDGGGANQTRMIFQANAGSGQAGISYLENLEPSGNVSIVAKVKAGAPTDADFDKDTDGLVVIDSTNGRIYFRYGGAWHYAAQDA